MTRLNIIQPFLSSNSLQNIEFKIYYIAFIRSIMYYNGDRYSLKNCILSTVKQNFIPTEVYSQILCRVTKYQVFLIFIGARFYQILSHMFRFKNQEVTVTKHRYQLLFLFYFVGNSLLFQSYRDPGTQRPFDPPNGLCNPEPRWVIVSKSLTLASAPPELISHPKKHIVFKP